MSSILTGGFHYFVGLEGMDDGGDSNFNDGLDYDVFYLVVTCGDELNHHVDGLKLASGSNASILMSGLSFENYTLIQCPNPCEALITLVDSPSLYLLYHS